MARSDQESGEGDPRPLTLLHGYVAAPLTRLTNLLLLMNQRAEKILSYGAIMTLTVHSQVSGPDPFVQVHTFVL